MGDNQAAGDVMRSMDSTGVPVGNQGNEDLNRDLVSSMGATDNQASGDVIRSMDSTGVFVGNQENENFLSAMDQGNEDLNQDLVSSMGATDVLAVLMGDNDFITSMSKLQIGVNDKERVAHQMFMKFCEKQIEEQKKLITLKDEKGKIQMELKHIEEQLNLIHTNIGVFSTNPVEYANNLANNVAKLENLQLKFYELNQKVLSFDEEISTIYNDTTSMFRPINGNYTQFIEMARAMFHVEVGTD